MPINTNDLAELTAQIAAAALDEAKWQTVLNSLHYLSGGVNAQMSCRNIQTGASSGAYYSGFDPFWVAQFQEYFHGLNPWTPKYNQVQPGAITSSQWLCSQRSLLNTEFYNDWIKPQEDTLYGASLMLVKEDHKMITLSGNIRRCDGEQKEREWMQLMQLIAPHLKQALNINKTLAGHSLERFVLNETSTVHTAAIILLSTTGRVLYTNPVACELLEEANIIKLSRLHRLKFIQSSATHQLDKILSTIRFTGNCLPSSFSLRHDNQQRFDCNTLSLQANRLAVSPYAYLLASDEPTIILTLKPVESEESKLEKLENIEQLTSAEKAVILQFHNGHSLRTIAEQRSTSIHTVRGQFKTSMAKLAVSSQTELIRLINQI